MYLILIGGGNVGTQLAKKLMQRGHEVLVLEKDGQQAQKLANDLGDEFVMHGDGCELHTQKLAGFNRADVVVAITGEDEDNLVCSQLAKEYWSVKRVVARINDPSHEQIFRDVGIDDTVSATGILYSLIDQQISANELIAVGHLHKGDVEVVESVLSHRSPLVGQKVRDVQLPAGTFFVYLVREGAGTAVNGDTQFMTGDMVVALVPIKSAHELRSVLKESQ